jgi:hypothetical protein
LTDRFPLFLSPRWCERGFLTDGPLLGGGRGAFTPAANDSFPPMLLKNSVLDWIKSF